MRLVAVRYAARDTNLYEFCPLDGAPLPAAEAGAHIDLFLPGNLARQYSLVHPGAAPESYTIGVKRDAQGRGGSRHIHDSLRVGAVLPVGGPRNNFPLAETAAPSVLIAGGIGITPIWCMAQALDQAGRDWTLHYSARSREDAAFLDVLDGRAGVHLLFDDESGGAFLDLAAIVAAAPADAHFYCCGPAPMLQAYQRVTADLPPEHVHLEFFDAPKPEARADDGAFTVELARSGRSVTVPEGTSILDALREAGLDLMSSCEAGICGICETRVLSGIPDHRDMVLTDAEHAANDRMMICCSRALSDRLVLDL